MLAVLEAERSQAFPSSIPLLDVNPICILDAYSCNPSACVVPSIFPRRSNPKSPSLLRQQLLPRLTASLSLLADQITSRPSVGMGRSDRFATITMQCRLSINATHIRIRFPREQVKARSPPSDQPPKRRVFTGLWSEVTFATASGSLGASPSSPSIVDREI